MESSEWAVTHYLEALIPGVHLHRRFVAQEALDVVHDISGVVTRDVGAPTGTHALCSVHEHHRHDWQVVAGLDWDAVVVDIVEDLVIVRVKDGAGDGAQARVDVPGLEEEDNGGNA
jgi:hypothetical protein